MSAAPALFSPGRIGSRELKNRILMAPMEKNLALPTGAVTQRYIEYCEARAAGGAALLLLESMYVHPAGQNHRYQLGIHDDELIAGYRRLIEACHRHDALVGAEWAFPYRVVRRAEGPNDGVVSVASATWGEHTEVWPGDHLNLVNWPNRHARRRGFWEQLAPDYGRVARRLAGAGF